MRALNTEFSPIVRVLDDLQCQMMHRPIARMIVDCYRPNKADDQSPLDPQEDRNKCRTRSGGSGTLEFFFK
eukprot:scaffold20461_cov117-Cylindrotheca_fusiformis.AAC.20